MAAVKSPAFQFYVKDWLSDPQLRQVCAATKGVWIDVLAFMWTAPERGVLSGSRDGLIRMFGCLESEFQTFIDDAERTGFCDISVTSNGDITLMSRRMVREEKARENNRIRQGRYRAARSGNGKVTPPSSSATASAKKSLSKDKQSEPALTSPKNSHFSHHVVECKDRIIASCKRLHELSLRNGKSFNGWAWVQQKANQRGHPQAIVECLEYIVKRWNETENPWAYAETVFKTKQPMFNERDHIAESQKFKKIWMSDDMRKLVGNVGRRM